MRSCDRDSLLFSGLIAVTALGVMALGTPVQAEPGVKLPFSKRPAPKPITKAEAKATAPAARLVSLSVVPKAVTIQGWRSQQGLVITGHYSNGTLRDLSDTAKITPSNPQMLAVAAEEDRRVLRPKSNGSSSVAISSPGAPTVTVPVVVEQFTAEQPVSFRNEVIPALTKLGCSAGTCHGTPTGKGGFRLSLQGYNPDLDYQTLVSEGWRRLNKAEPGRSILLLKPMVQVPHAGGKRLSAEQPEFQVLSRWISEGARDDGGSAPTVKELEILPGKRTLKLPAGAKQRVVAMARFSDGTQRDVTHLAKLDTSNLDLSAVSRGGLVEATERGDIAVLARFTDLMESERLVFLKDVEGFKWVEPPVQNYIDKHIYDRLKLFQVPASELSSDSEFLRRAYLDTVGLLPTANEVRKFQADPSPDRRSRVIDELTTRPEFADQWAVKWADVLRVQDETLQEEGAKSFHNWIRNSLATNKPVDQFVREIVTAKGTPKANPASGFFHSYTAADDFSQAISQLFMGVRMTCAKCHNHPFERWTQDDYYSFAAFFSQVRAKPTKDSTGEVFLDPKGEVNHLRTGKVMQPKALGAASWAKAEPGTDRRDALATWLTSPENPFFAKAMVNRIWANVLGRGLVEPIDDFRDSNPSVNDPLLEALAKDFVESKFDFRHLVRTIMKSRTYQLSAKPLPLNKNDVAYFSHSLARIMSAEQLLDSISQFTEVGEEFPGYPTGTRAAQLASNKARTPFLKVFGRPDRNLNCECEREKDPTLFQALALMNGRNLHGKLGNANGRISRLAASGRPDGDVLEELYLAAFARKPTDRERGEWLTYIGKAPDKKQAYEDLGWVLINSKEFLFRH